MDSSLRSSLTVTIISIVGLMFVLLSPSRDTITNWTLLLGMLMISILLLLNFLFQIFHTFKKTHYVFFIIKILNFNFIVLSIVGMLFGKLLATISPFFFLPFGYYLFLSFTITYIFFYEIRELYHLYLNLRANNE